MDPRQKVTCGEAVVAMVLNALGKWIMRVPETLSEAKEVLENADTEKMKSTSLNGYRLFSIEVEYDGVKQRETKTLEEKIKKEKEQVEKEVWHLSNQEFYSEEDALQQSGRRRLIHSFSYSLQNRVEIGGEKNKIAMTC